MMEKAARAACDFYIGSAAADGIPYWDTGAPGLANSATISPARPTPSTSRSRSTAPPPPSRRRGWSAWAGSWAEGGPSRYTAAGLTVARPIRRPLPELDPAPGPDSALGLSPPQRLGRRPGRVLDVGRLPCPPAGDLPDQPSRKENSFLKCWALTGLCNPRLHGGARPDFPPTAGDRDGPSRRPRPLSHWDHATESATISQMHHRGWPSVASRIYSCCT